MDTPLSDDDYEIITNPGDLSLDTSACNLTVWEPPPCHASSDKIAATTWTPQQIQEYVHKFICERYKVGDKIVRIYMDGSFDPLTVSHRLCFRQAKLSFPKVQLIVGVFSDKTISEQATRDHIPKPLMKPEAERFEQVRHCRWVDRVIEGKWQLDEAFLNLHEIDFVAIEETFVNPDYHRERITGYESIPIRQITGIQQSLLSLPSFSGSLSGAM